MNSYSDISSKRYALHEAGKLTAWAEYCLEVPGLGAIEGKQFVKDSLAATGCEISINSLLPGAGMPFYHKHEQNEEVYIFLKGQGEMQVDAETFQVQEGSMVRISPAGMRSWRNTGSEPLIYLIIQVKENSLEQYSLTDGVVGEGPVIWSDN